MLFVLHLAPFCLVFCTKMQCILHQNAVCFAPKRSAFSTKTQPILHQNAVYFDANSTIFAANSGHSA